MISTAIMRGAATLASLALLVGCEAPPLRVRVSDTIRATTPGGSDTILRFANVPRYARGAIAVPELSIGVADGPPEYALAGVREVLPLRDGAVLVVDRGSGPDAKPIVRQYDGDGKHVRTIGRYGQGPGEYEWISGLAELRDGRILIRDSELNRVNLYSAAGEPLDTWRLEPQGTVFRTSNQLFVDTSDVVHVRAPVAERRSLRDPAPPMGFIRMRADGTLIDTLHPPDLPSVRLPSQGPISTPYSPASVWAWSPHGYFVTGVSTRYAIDLRIPRAADGAHPPLTWRPGDPVVSIRREVPAVPVGDAERSARRAEIESALRKSGGSWEGPDIPNEKPPYRDVRVAVDGRIWMLVSVPSVAHVPTPDEAGDPNRNVPFREPLAFDIIEPNGTYLGRFVLPEGVMLRAMRGDTLWGVTRDENDVPRLTRFRLEWR